MSDRCSSHILPHQKLQEADEEQNVREEVYKTILSIDEMQEAEVPTQIKAEDKTPEESIEFAELKAQILESMKKLPRRERELIEYKFFKDCFHIFFKLSPVFSSLF